MEDRFRELCKRLKDITNLDEGRRDLAGILSRTASVAQEILGADMAYAAADVNGNNLVSVSDSRSSTTRTEEWRGPGPLGQIVLDTKETKLWSAGVDPEPRGQDLLDFADVGSWMATRISVSAEPPGMLTVMRSGAESFDADDGEILRILAEHASSAIDNITVFQSVESLSVTDELTEIYNYRFLKAALRREVERASRYGHVFSIIMLDVDHLKAFNEKHGHLAGSELLRRMAGILVESSRAIDLVAKYGGDEFLIILPQTDTEGAETMGNRICRAVAATQFDYCELGAITMSAGVASFPEHGATMRPLLAAADESLFRAKRSGRNCVVVATGPGNPGQIPEVA